MKRFIRTKGTLGQGLAVGLCALGVAGSSAWGQTPAGPDSASAKSAESRTAEPPIPKAAPRPTADVDADVMPIDWPGVLELARASNIEIQLAAERVHEAQSTLGVAKTQWLPSLNVGATYLKHEGQTQTIPGNIITASKGALFGGGIANATLDPQRVAIEVMKAKQQVYAQSGALDRTTRQTLQESSQAYMDLLASQSAAAIAMEIEEQIARVVERNEKWKREKFGAQIEVLIPDAKLQSQRQRLVQAKQNQLAASAQLVHLLHLPPSTRLFANEEHIVPLKLVDENRPEAELIKQTHDQGPGLAEVLAMVKVLEEQSQQARRIMMLPTITGTVGEGAFGGGTGGNLGNFGNSLDVGVGAYWDVMKFVGASRAGQIFDSKRRQASLQQQDVMSKLSMGVIVARQAAIQSRQRIEMAEKEIEIARDVLDKSWQRLKLTVTDSSEVLQGIGTLGTARGNYLQAVADYNRAQIQLQYLLGEHMGPAGAEPLKQAVIDVTPPGASSSIFAPQPQSAKNESTARAASAKEMIPTASPEPAKAVLHAEPAPTSAPPAKATDRISRYFVAPWRK